MSKAFGALQALEDVDFSVGEGEIVGMIGPNGAGKTTFLNCITGVILPDTGEVVFRDRTITRWSTHRRAQAGIIRTFQSVRLFDESDAIENVVLGGYRARPYGVVGAIAPRRRHASVALADLSRRLLSEVGLDEGQWRRPVSQLGHGERRLVELARAVAGSPALICLDEPTAGLNETESARFAQWLRTQVASGLSVILISHDMPLVMRNCDRVFVLNGGRPVASGHPDEVRRDPAVIEAYLGDDAGRFGESLAAETVGP
jgi:branched-chain amino acid transport system ATP-binding protein